MTLYYTISISNMTHIMVPGHQCNTSYEVTQQEVYNVSVKATNDVGESDSISMITSMCVCVCVCVCVKVWVGVATLLHTLAISVETSASVVQIGHDFALLNITVQRSRPCHRSTILDILLTYSDNNTLNRTLLIKYHPMADNTGELVHITKLVPGTTYSASIHYYDHLATVSFRTLNITDTVTGNASCHECIYHI